MEAARESGVATFAVGDAVDPIALHGGRRRPKERQPDPHFWTDPDRVRKASRASSPTRSSSTSTGVDERAIRKNADRYASELGELTAWMEQSFDGSPPASARLVTNHHVFGYLAQRFGFRVIGAVIPSGTTLASPSASDLNRSPTAIETGRRTGRSSPTPRSPTGSPRSCKRRATSRSQVVPLFSESLTAKGEGAATYLQMMRANTKAISAGLATG